ncbi:MAG: hypothetical protein P1R58_12535 [bacterium]|nr:hypothetical protein [bacterium]
MFRKICLFSVLSLSLVLASCSIDSEADTGSVETAFKAASTNITMPANTPIKVRLVDSIDTDVQVTGSVFRAVLADPIIVNGSTLFTSGAMAKGVLNHVVESGRLKTPAELSFSITAIKNTKDRWIDVGTIFITEKKGSHTDREVAMIGGGAIVGGIIGKIINRDGSTEIGAAAGAVAGTGLSAATGKQDIFYGVGTEVIFYSSEATQVAM